MFGKKREVVHTGEDGSTTEYDPETNTHHNVEKKEARSPAHGFLQMINPFTHHEKDSDEVSC